MVASNQERIGQGLQILSSALEPWVIQRLTTVLGSGWWDVVDQEAVARTGRGIGTNYADPYFQLTVLISQWNRVFGQVLGKAERSYVGELLEIRNRWAHPQPDKPFLASDTERALDTMARLAQAISAQEQTKKLVAMRAAVLSGAFDAARKQEQRRQVALPLEGAASAGLRPWREVIDPHQDVTLGRYNQADFAADLGQVARGEATLPEYGEPKAFFARTFLTVGLSALLVSALQRLAGKPEGDPVVELQTNFGGGKTHSMLALYHLVAGLPSGELPGIEPILARAGVAEIPTVRRVVLVGTALSPGEARRHDGHEVRTLWGELAWQLGGAPAYERLANADAHGVSPGSDILRELFRDFGPALILIDEWVTYIRQTWSDASLPAGSFDANISFAQALTEAVAASERTLLVASLPTSEIEKGGEGGVVATERLKHVVGRIQSPWRPASPQEGFEIVRRRLFGAIEPDRVAARDATVQAFADLYARARGDFPREAHEAAYQRQMSACYPIHPELFDRLFGAWATLEKFQQTRGVLRLMAVIIQTLFERGDPGPLILPASVPIDEPRVQSELTRYLEEQWVPVIERDVDGEHSVPLALDRENAATLGRFSAARRVARTVYMGSAPMANAATRGIDDQHIKLGSVQPGESPAVFGDALRRLAGRATYLYDNAGQYWFSTQASVNRLAADRAAQQREADVSDEIRRRLRLQQAERGPFARVHAAPAAPGDVPDEEEAGLVILGPEVSHSSKSEASSAAGAARTILDQRGSGARRHRNALVFLAADTDKLGALNEAARTYLAWKSIDEGKADLVLDTSQLNQIATRRKDADETVAARIPEAYQWLLVPTQPDPLGPITFPATRLTGSGALAPRAGAKLVTDGGLITKYGGVTLHLELAERHPEIWTDGDVDLRHLWELFTTYVYLPRLRDRSVLGEAVRDGAAGLLWRETFAYAAGRDASGRYLGLIGGHGFEPLFDGQGRIVRPELALAQMEADEASRGYGERPGHGGPAGSVSDGAVSDGAVGAVIGASAAQPAPSQPTPAAKPDPTDFYGRITLDGQRPQPKFGQVAEEVIARLGLDGTKVEVSVEIRAHRPAGFPADTRRTITENVSSLKFDPGAGFEEE